jgi:hypothetical protein
MGWHERDDFFFEIPSKDTWKTAASKTLVQYVMLNRASPPFMWYVTSSIVHQVSYHEFANQNIANFSSSHPYDMSDPFTFLDFSTVTNLEQQHLAHSNNIFYIISLLCNTLLSINMTEYFFTNNVAVLLGLCVSTLSIYNTLHILN